MKTRQKYSSVRTEQDTIKVKQQGFLEEWHE
jgi:hypothetical protein